MTQEQAFELGKKYIETHDTVIVLSDSAVYLNNDVEYMENHAKETGKTAFVIKGKATEVKSVEETETPIEKKSKKTK